MAASFSRGVAAVLFHHNIVQRSGQDGAAAHWIGLHSSASWGNSCRAPDPYERDRQESTMKQYNATRAAWLGATAAVVLAASAGIAAADNAATAPTTTTTQPSQQTGVTAPATQPGAGTSAPASATSTAPSKTYPTRIWIKRAERGTRGSTKH